MNAAASLTISDGTTLLVRITASVSSRSAAGSPERDDAHPRAEHSFTEEAAFEFRPLLSAFNPELNKLLDKRLELFAE